MLSEKAQSNTAETSIIPPDELNKIMEGFSVNYFMVDVRRDRKSFYALVPELFSNPPLYQYSEYSTDFDFLRRSFAGAYGSLRLTGGRPEGPDEGKEAVRKEAAGPGLPLT